MAPHLAHGRSVGEGGGVLTDRRARAVAALCVTEIVSWGVLYYAFPVLAGRLVEQTGWSRTAATGAFSLGALVSAGAAVVVGRLIDRHGPRPVMTAGSVVGVLGIAGAASAPTLPVFYGAWALTGVAQAATLYPPAFAAVTGWYDDDGHERRTRALTTVTLAGGFASTVFAPLTAALLAHLTWRGTYLVLAGVLLLVTVPLHLFALSPPWSRARGSTPDADPDAAADPDARAGPDTDAAHARRVLHSGRFVLLAVVVPLAGFGLYAATINLVPLLTGRGVALGTAALGLGLTGVGQVTGRVFFAPLARRTSPAVRACAVIVLGSLGVLALAVLPGPTALLLGVAVVAGAGRGMHTLLQASVVADRWGTRAFGRINGVFSAPMTLAVALAPAGGVLVAGLVGGFPGAFGVLGGVALVAGLVALLT